MIFGAFPIPVFQNSSLHIGILGNIIVTFGVFLNHLIITLITVGINIKIKFAPK